MGNTDLDVIPSSPLAVNTDHMCVITLPSLEFHDFDALPVKTTLYNNGRTVTMNGIWSSDKRPSISGSSLIDRYCFSHLHFHWTENNNLGSEHTINGKCHAMEMHLIFFKRSCKTIFEAESQQNGYVTLAYVFNVSYKSDNTIYIIHRFNFIQTKIIIF
uniref:Carbonic anhydrase n=1 Tax=Sipha flava TaxID=143950 RepID=A0A2S2QZB9_9HEMI